VISLAIHGVHYSISGLLFYSQRPDIAPGRLAGTLERIAPDAKIVFLTQNGDSDVVQAATSDGADGYILKTDAETELLTTVDAVVGVDDFLERGMGGSDSDKTDA